MDNITTTDFSKFGFLEREEAEKLLKASREQGFPDDFYDSGTTIMFNMNSGNVFFTNDDCQVCMLNGDDLESFYFCPECGNEGFNEEYPFIKYHGYCSKECYKKNK